MAMCAIRFLANYFARAWPKTEVPRKGSRARRCWLAISGIQTSGGLLIRFVRPFDRNDATAPGKLMCLYDICACFHTYNIIIYMYVYTYVCKKINSVNRICPENAVVYAIYDI